MSSLVEIADEAQRLSGEGKFSEAVAAYDQILAVNDTIAEVHLNKGVALTNAGELPQALAAFQRAAKLNPDLVGAHVNSGNVLKRMGRHEEAVDAFREAVRLDGSLVNAWTSLAHEPYLERACEGHATANNLFGYGLCLLHLEKDEEAAAVLKRAQGLDPANWRGNVALGTVYMRQKKWEDAAAAFAKALEHDEPRKDSTVNFNYAVALMQCGRDSEARGPLEMVVSAEPDNHVALALLGTLYLAEQDFANAADVLERAAALDGAAGDSSVFYNLGYAKLMQDRPEEALGSFEKALEKDPKSEQARAAVAALKNELPAGGSPSGSNGGGGSSPISRLSKRLSKRGSKASASGLSEAELQAAIRVARGNGADPQLSEEEMARRAQRAKSPLERVQAILSPQRPAFLRRPSMEGIQAGFVEAMATVYDEITRENLED